MLVGDVGVLMLCFGLLVDCCVVSKVCILCFGVVVVVVGVDFLIVFLWIESVVGLFDFVVFVYSGFLVMLIVKILMGFVLK